MTATKRDRAFAAKLRELPTAEEWQEFFAHGFDDSNPTHVRDRALFLLMYRAGLRVGEACSLDLSGLDMAEGRVDVPDVPGLTKRGARTTYFPAMSADLGSAIEAWLVVRETWKPQTTRLFVTRSGKAIENTTIMRQGIRNAAIRTWNNGGLTPLGHRVHSHALRHSFATDAVNNGAPINVIQAALGHTKPDMSLRYVRANPLQVKAWMERSAE